MGGAYSHEIILDSRIHTYARDKDRFISLSINQHLDPVPCRLLGLVDCKASYVTPTLTECEINRRLLEPRCYGLFREIEADFKASQIPSDKWYLTALSALTTTPKPHLADQLHLYLSNQDASSTADARRALI